MAVGLAALAFVLFVVIVAMGATWPGKRPTTYLLFFKLDHKNLREIAGRHRKPRGFVIEQFRRHLRNSKLE